MTVTCKYDDGTIEAHFVAETEATDYGVPGSPTWHEVIDDTIEIQTLAILGVDVDPASLPKALQTEILELAEDLNDQGPPPSAASSKNALGEMDAWNTRTDTDALAARDARVRAEALRDAADTICLPENGTAGDPQDQVDRLIDEERRMIRRGILALIPADQEGDQ